MSFRVSNNISHVMEQYLSPQEQKAAQEAAAMIVELSHRSTADLLHDSSPKIEIVKDSHPAELDQSTGMYMFTCPHCDMWTEVPVNQVNCHIFRHAFLVQKLPNGGIILLNQLNPHAPKQVCDQLKSEGKIVGCGKPFKFIRKNDKYVVESCGYI